jgi:hypothetical protein
MLQRRENLFVPDAIKPGDIIGFSGDNWISALVNVATYGIPFWSLSHCGIMGHAADGRLMLFESTQLDDLPCEITGEIFHGTQAHVLEHVVHAYKGKVWHYPLFRSLYPDEDARLTEFLMGTIHTPYDQLGAFRSAGVGLSWIESLLHRANLNSIFCSEWCCAAHTFIGLFRTDNVSRWNPNRFVRRERLIHVLRQPVRLK